LRSICFLGVIIPSFLFPSNLALDPQEVTNHEYVRFVQAVGHPPPEYWIDGRYPEGTEEEPVVLVNWYDAVAYCRWSGGKRLPTVDEWLAVCKSGNLKKIGNIWEWTSTDVATELGTSKALCGPSNSCDCSHRYLPEWKNMVKGFRCAGDPVNVTSIPSIQSIR